jgi:hypothetical protein
MGTLNVNWEKKDNKQSNIQKARSKSIKICPQILIDQNQGG